MHNSLSHDLDALLDCQKAAWIAGKRPRIEDILSNSSLPRDPEVLLDLLYHEIILREELGEAPAIDEYIQHYPHLADDLKLHFEVHAALQDNLLDQTNHLQGAEEELDSSDTSLTLRDYDLLAPLGRGGMGVVYQARHRRLNRLVALKMFQPGRVPSPRELERFHTEAEAIARLQHPNIVQIFEVGQSKGLPFLALELAEGGTLAQKLQNLPFTPKAAAELLKTLAGAVQHAHDHHIVHRDLKPANVLFTREGTPKLTDFGLAKVLEESTESPRDETRTGEPIGTPRYMAPEQAAGRPDLIGPTTDVYALGTLLYECLTGQVPFVAASAVATMEMIRTEEPLSPRRLQRTIARDLETICLKCLHKQPARRYGSAKALADDLGHFLLGEPIRARPTPTWERVWMWCRRRPALAVLSAVALVSLCAGVVFFGVYRHLEGQRINRARADLTALVREGQDAVDQHDYRKAQDRFLRALTLIRAEPVLQDHELGVAGWLDHSRRQADQELSQRRRPPPLFEERRDEALVLCLLLDPAQPQSRTTAREAIQAALSLTIPGDSAWRLEREQLALLEADLSLREGDPAAALALLDQAQGIESRLWQHRRAERLDRLGRKTEAEQARRHAEELAPTDALAYFLSGIDRFHQRDLSAAIRDFDAVLAREPDHFMARLFQAACFLREKRLGEGQVALTACLGQRPQFAWTYLLRGQLHLQLQDRAAALADFQRGLETQPREGARFALLSNRGIVHLQSEQWSLARADFEEALRLQSDAPEVRLGRGLAALGQGDYRLAVADAQDAPSGRDERQLDRARLFAQAAVLVQADEREPDRAGKRTQWECRSIDLLRLSLQQLPEPDRRTFWNETILPDTRLRSLKQLPAFQNLAPAAGQEESDNGLDVTRRYRCTIV